MLSQNSGLSPIIFCYYFPIIFALQAADLHRQYKLATADAIVYASALVNNAQLLTCDAHFANLPNALYIRKV